MQCNSKVESKEKKLLNKYKNYFETNLELLLGRKLLTDVSMLPLL